MKRADDLQFLILKEQSRLKHKIFHICDPYDIASVKYYEDERSKVLKGKDLFNVDENAPL